MLATGETAPARDACRELTEIAEGYGRDGVLGAMAAHARGPSSWPKATPEPP
jgi:hypothetical protein